MSRALTPYQSSVLNLKRMTYTLQKHLKFFKNSYIMLQDDEKYLNMWICEKGMLGLINFMTVTPPDARCAIKLQELQNRSIHEELPKQPNENIYINKFISQNQCQLQQSQNNIQNQSDSESIGDEQIDYQPHDEENLKLQNSEMKQYKRGPYKNYSTQEKQRAVKMLLQDRLSVIDISRRLGIPCKNIKRWSQQGVERKKGGGRKKFSPQTQKAVACYFRKKYPLNSEVSYEQLQQTARKMSKDENFKASRGWVVKFVQRQNLKSHFKLI